MKKTTFCILFLSFTILLAQTAIAGSKCYNWSPYDNDWLKVTVTTQDPSNPANKLLTGVLYYPGGYYLPFIGTLVKDADGVSKRFSIHLTNNNTGAFGGYRDCVLDATLGTTKPIQGPLECDCGTGGFVNTGTLIQVPCSTLPDPAGTLLEAPEAASMAGFAN